MKEEHARIAEHEIIILWTDYFRPEHAEKHTNLHDLVWKTCKLTSTVKQQINKQAAQDLLAGMQQIAEIFWETKGVKTTAAPVRPADRRRDRPPRPGLTEETEYRSQETGGDPLLLSRLPLPGAVG